MKNKLKKIILSFIILSIVAIIILFILKNKFANDNKQLNIVDKKYFEKFQSEYEENTVLPRNISELYNYNGEYDRDVLYKNMKQFVDYMDYLNFNVKEDDASEFYKKNSSEILQILGIRYEEKFIEFFKQVKSKKLAKDEFKYAEVELNSSYNQSKYYYFNLNLYYGENLDVNKFKVGFARSKNNSFVVCYQFIK
jgi:hypothetical protein